MEYRALGNSGLQVSVIGLGGSTFGGTCDAAQTASILDAAFDCGVNVIDTADSYSEGLSEQYVGRFLRSKRDQWVVMTKFALPMGEGPNRAGASRGYIRKAVEDSLRRLGTEYIDVYQVHRPDPETPAEETMSVLHDLVTEGKVRYIGCSNYAGWQIVQANEVAKRYGWTPFVSSQPRYNLLERAIESEHIPACETYGVGLIPYSPLAGGFLTGKYERGQQPPEGTRYASASPIAERVFTDRNFDRLDALRSLAASRGQSMTALAIGWLVAHPISSTVIIGATGPEQIAEGVAAAGVALSTADRAELAELTRR
jgi:aryl-alcohol dehydrogenase-like predicted oxidoreductase